MDRRSAICIACVREIAEAGLELTVFSAGSRMICVERDAEPDADLHEKVVVEQFKLLQPLFSSDLKQSLIPEMMTSLVKDLAFYQ